MSLFDKVNRLRKAGKTLEQVAAEKKTAAISLKQQEAESRQEERERAARARDAVVAAAAAAKVAERKSKEDAKPAPAQIRWGVEPVKRGAVRVAAPFAGARQVSLIEVNRAPVPVPIRFDADCLDYLRGCGAREVQLYLVMRNGGVFMPRKQVSELPAVLSEYRGTPAAVA